MTNASQTRLTKVHPRLAAGVTALINALAAQGLVVEVVQGLRSFAEQDELFRQGRTKPGQIVTSPAGLAMEIACLQHAGYNAAS